MLDKKNYDTLKVKPACGFKVTYGFEWIHHQDTLLTLTDQSCQQFRLVMPNIDTLLLSKRITQVMQKLLKEAFPKMQPFHPAIKVHPDLMETLTKPYVDQILKATQAKAYYVESFKPRRGDTSKKELFEGYPVIKGIKTNLEPLHLIKLKKILLNHHHYDLSGSVSLCLFTPNFGVSLQNGSEKINILVGLGCDKWRFIIKGQSPKSLEATHGHSTLLAVIKKIFPDIRAIQGIK